MPLPAGTTGSGPRRDAMSDGQNAQAQPCTMTVWPAEELAELKKLLLTAALEVLVPLTVWW